MEKNPFSVYDFLGYVFPGSITLMVIIFINFLHTHELLLSLYSCNLFVEYILRDFSWDDSLFFILSAYVLGHIVAYASSLTIEPYAVWRFGYPSKFMLSEQSTKKYYSFKEGTKTWKKLCIVIFKTIVAGAILPVYLCDQLLGSLCCLNTYYVKSLDDKISNSIVQKVKMLYKHLDLDSIYSDDDIKNYDIDYHRVVYHYVYEKHDSHRTKMDNYVALYGFMRALTFIMVLLFWISLFVIKSEYDNAYLDSGGTIKWLIGIIALNFFFFMGFMKFYRRFTLECLMCLVTDPDLKYDPSTTLSSHDDYVLIQL